MRWCQTCQWRSPWSLRSPLKQWSYPTIGTPTHTHTRTHTHTHTRTHTHTHAHTHTHTMTICMSSLCSDGVAEAQPNDLISQARCVAVEVCDISAYTNPLQRGPEYETHYHGNCTIRSGNQRYEHAHHRNV